MSNSRSTLSWTLNPSWCTLAARLCFSFSAQYLLITAPDMRRACSSSGVLSTRCPSTSCSVCSIMATSVVVSSAPHVSKSSGVASFNFFSTLLFFAACGLMPDFVTLFVDPWKASVDCCDLVAARGVLPLGGMFVYVRWILRVVCDASRYSSCARRRGSWNNDVT